MAEPLRIRAGWKGGVAGLGGWGKRERDGVGSRSEWSVGRAGGRLGGRCLGKFLGSTFFASPGAGDRKFAEKIWAFQP